MTQPASTRPDPAPTLAHAAPTTPPPGAAAAPRTLPEVFLATCARRGDAEAFRHPDGAGWASLTWRQTQERAQALAAGLLDVGVRAEDRVAIASATRIEWVLCDLAVLLAGAATTTVYPNTVAEDVAFILADSGAVLVVAEDATQREQVRAHRAELPAVGHVVVLDADGVDVGTDGWVLTLADLEARGRARLGAEPGCVDAAVAATGPQHLATLIYTSGTTGRPKGVELTHAAWVWLASAVDEAGILREDDLQFLWLPLSHVFGKLLLAGSCRIGLTTAVDGRMDRIVENLATIRPTFMAAAPRVFEKVHARVTTTAHEHGGAKARIFDWAVGVGTRCADLEQAGRPVPAPLRAQRALADRLVFSTVRGRLGGRIRVLVSGSAALSPEVARWFAGIGLPVCEGYGMTEGAGAAFVNRPGAVRIGTVGQPLPGVEVRIADDGEILLRTPGATRGYRNLPEETAALLPGDGWLATGDVGEVDADGYLRITDRKKDLVKTSGGKYIAPSLVEGALKAACPLVAHAVVVADGRRFPGALLTLDPDTTAGKDPVEVHRAVAEAVEKVNARLNPWERVKQFRVLDGQLTVEGGELTPSLKIRRAAVGQRYADVLEEMYREQR